jgi:glycosyltransferase involved in cell wall biosynthesis
MNLLVATEFPPNASGGGPAVVRQMLKNWPVENLSWWSCLPDVQDQFGQCVRKHWCAVIPWKCYPYRKWTSLKSAFLESLWTPYAARHLRRTLQGLKPDIVWVIPHDWSIPPLARALAGKWQRYHVTVQDYVDVHDNRRRFGFDRCKHMAAMADWLYADATTRDATSYPMIADLRARTGADAAQMLHAGLEAEDFEYLAKGNGRPANTIHIGYAGTILVEEVFELFVSALESVRSALPKRVELHLFGAHSYAKRRWFNREWMVENGNLREPELLAKLRNCDWAFAPMALTDNDPRYNRFSFPTKFITYLAAGLPVITLGHPESSVMKMAARYDVGLTTSTGDSRTLSEQLRAALNDPSPWNSHGKEIIRCARTEFDAERMRRTLHDCFQKCAAKG